MGLTSQANYQASELRRIVYRKSGGDNTQYGAGLNFLDMALSAGDPGAITPVTANTTSGVVPTRATAGYPDIGALVAANAYLSRVQFTKGGDGTTARLTLYDRLWEAGTFAIGSSPYTLSGQPSFVSRLPGGSYVGTQLWAMGGGNNAGTTVSVTYTNQSGTTGRTTPTTAIPYFLAGTPPGHFDMFRLPLQAGDSGIQKVEGVTITNGTSTAVCHLMIIRPLWSGTVSRPGTSDEMGMMRTGLPEVFADSALAVMCQYSMVSVSPSLDVNLELAVFPFDISAHPGTLVVELLFEDGAGAGNAANTGSLGGSFVVGGSLTPSIVATGGHDGNGYLQFGDAGTSDNGGCASDGHPPQLKIGTADFEISVYAQFVRYDTAWGQAFWGWEFGNPSPRLYCEDVTGKLRFVDGTVNYDTGFTCPIDSTWRKYTLKRLSGVAYVLVDEVPKFSVAYTSDCNVGADFGSFRVGADGNASGGQCGKFDDFRFYNGNV